MLGMGVGALGCLGWRSWKSLLGSPCRGKLAKSWQPLYVKINMSRMEASTPGASENSLIELTPSSRGLSPSWGFRSDCERENKPAVEKVGGVNKLQILLGHSCSF